MSVTRSPGKRLRASNVSEVTISLSASANAEYDDIVQWFISAVDALFARLLQYSTR